MIPPVGNAPHGHVCSDRNPAVGTGEGGDCLTDAEFQVGRLKSFWEQTGVVAAQTVNVTQPHRVALLKTAEVAEALVYVCRHCSRGLGRL